MKTPQNNSVEAWVRRTTLYVILISIFAIVLAFGLKVKAITPPSAGILFLVNSTGDGDENSTGVNVCETSPGSGVCTLRAAIDLVNARNNGGDGIFFNIPASDPGCSGGVCTITLDSALPNLSVPVNISGPGANQLTVKRTTASGAAAFSIFDVTSTGTVSISGMRITNGNSSGGGGVRLQSTGTVNITNCIVTGNIGGTNAAGGIANIITGTMNVTGCTISNNSRGGIYNDGTLNVTGSVVTGNSGIGILNTGALASKSGLVGTATIDSASITGNSGNGIFNDGTSNLTVTDSTISGNSGGGIFNFAPGVLSVTRCTISNNTVNGGTTGSLGGGIYALSEGSSSPGTVNITNSTIIGNSTINASTSTLGGGIAISGNNNVTITNSTIANNMTSSSGSGGGIFSAGQLTVTGSTFSGNAAANGGGIDIGGGSATLTNCTLSGNTAHFDCGTNCGGSGGGIGNAQRGTVSVSNCTITGNSADGAGGVANGGAFNIKSTIVAGNTFTNTSFPSPDAGGRSFTSQGFNLIGKTDGSTGFTAATDKTGTIASPLDPKLDPRGLRNNGGPTDTIALVTGSPAIDQGTSDSLTGKLTTDQRGVGYARRIDKSIPNAVGGDGTDIGAFESGAQIRTVSRKTHGSAGTFDISLPLTGPRVGVECREGGSSGVFEVILTFPVAITVDNVSVTPDPNAAGATASVSSASVSGHQVTVNLTGVSNAQILTITLSDVSDGTNTNDVDVRMGVLLGDTNNSGSVTSSDVTLTQSKVNQAVTKSNFREDVTVDGSINTSDVNLVQSEVGAKLP